MYEHMDPMYDKEDFESESEYVPPKPNWWTVAVYEVNCAYGGPEEGGWWYDYGDIVDTNPPMHFFTAEEAY